MPPVVIYLSGFRQNAGKTVAALGIISSLRRVLDPSRIGYLKPVGQEVIALPDGRRIDRDALIIDTFAGIPDLDLQHLSPVRLASGFTKRYLDSANREEESERLAGEIRLAMERLEHKDVILAEGTGHPGVGSIVRLSNARVANLTGAQIVYLSGGGIGKALDQLEVDLSYFLSKRSRVRGVIFNRLVPEKIPTMRRYLTEELLNRQFSALDGSLRVFGYLPAIEGLDRPSMQLVHRRWTAPGPGLSGEPPSGAPGAGAAAGGAVVAIGDPDARAWKAPCREIKVVSKPAANLRREGFLHPGDIVILSSSHQTHSRSILRFNRKLRESTPGLGGLILTAGLYHPLDPMVRRDIERSGLPAMQVPEHTAIAEERLLEIYQSTKLQVYDEGKAEQIGRLFAEHFDLDRFLTTFGLRP